MGEDPSWDDACDMHMISVQHGKRVQALNPAFAFPVRESHDAVYDDDDELDAEEPEQRLEIEYISPVAAKPAWMALRTTFTPSLTIS